MNTISKKMTSHEQVYCIALVKNHLSKKIKKADKNSREPDILLEFDFYPNRLFLNGTHLGIVSHRNGIVTIINNKLKDNFMIAEKIKAQLRTGILEYCVMQILRRGEVYASDIIEELLEEDIIKVEGIIYPLLMRLKHEDLIQYEWTEAQNDLPKKHYQLTESGRNTVKALDETWIEINKSAKKIKKKTDEQLKLAKQNSEEGN